MNEYVLSPSALVMISGSSKGTQVKYYEDNYWYKLDQNGYEGKAEWMSSYILGQSSIDNYVEYERCKINNRSGCRSKNFLQPNESFISFARLYELLKGKDLTTAIMNESSVRNRLDLVKDFLYEHTGNDFARYISNTLSFDMLTLNTDRHFNNMGIIVSSEGYREAPIFDNGKALFSDFERFPHETLEENIECAAAQPFSGSFESQAYEAGFDLKIRYSPILEEFKNINGRAEEILLHQLERYEKIFCLDKDVMEFNRRFAGAIESCKSNGNGEKPRQKSKEEQQL